MNDFVELTTFGAGQQNFFNMQIELLLLFFVIAVVYSSAGFGGGSSYLAVLALFALPMETLRPAALLCNLVVVSGNLIIFWKNGQLKIRQSAPLMLAGIPLAFLGGFWKLSERNFFLLLGFGLLAAAIAMWAQNRLSKPLNDSPASLPDSANIGIGGVLGFLAGLTGIGGGIFLSPLLNLLRWDTPKIIAATASLFIFCQSAAGLAGQLARRPTLDWASILPLLAVVLLGGQVGARWSAGWFPQARVRNLTAALVFYAGLTILWRHL